MCHHKLHGIENIWPDSDVNVSSVSNLKSNAANDELKNRLKYNYYIMVKNHPFIQHRCDLS